MARKAIYQEAKRQNISNYTAKQTSKLQMKVPIRKQESKKAEKQGNK